jgi:lipopolysaccharide export system protein LptA
MRRLALLAAISLLPAALPAQDFGDSRCIMVVDTMLRYRRIEQGGNLTFYAGGLVRLSCLGTSVRMQADSLMAIDNFRVTYFIGNVHYSDSTMDVTAARGTYFKDGERWEARGNVVARNLRTHSTLTGPSLDYLRPIPGLRDTVEMYAVSRPRIDYLPQDSAGRTQEPYVINGDRVRFRGNDRVYAGGRVTVDRSDFAARGDSLRLDTGRGQDGLLSGNAVMEGKGSDPYTLSGKRVHLRLQQNQLTGVRAVVAARAVTSEWDLVADTIDLTLRDNALVQTLAWGDSVRPRGVSPEREIRADSLAIDTPDRRLTEARLFGRGWVGAKVDSLTGERDWLEGDSVTARFAAADSGPPRNVLREVDARGRARSYYRINDRSHPEGPSISYVRGDRIQVLMLASGAAGVARVDVRGAVDGVQLQPVRTRPDSARVDSLRTTVDSLRRNGTR